MSPATPTRGAREWGVSDSRNPVDPNSPVPHGAAAERAAIGARDGLLTLVHVLVRDRLQLLNLGSHVGEQREVRIVSEGSEKDRH